MQVLTKRTACSSKPSMLYLTKSFTCVIVSGWCDQVGFQTVFEDVKALRIPGLLWKFIPITDSRRQERSIVKTRIRMLCL